MKKTFTFIPLGIGISASIIYVFNIIQFRIINNSATLFQILSNLKIYLYIAIAGFVTYFFVRLLTVVSEKNKYAKEDNIKDKKDEVITDNSYEPFEAAKNLNFDTQNVSNNTVNTYVPNYDYVPMYHSVEKENKVIKEEKVTIQESDDINKIVVNGDKYCQNCGEKIYETDNFCSNCGFLQKKVHEKNNAILKAIINVLEIVILLLIIYFSLNMLFEYKEKLDPNFESPFRVGMTK